MFLKCMELYKDGTERWARAAAAAFDVLKTGGCHEVPTPEWWNDEALKALSARVLQAAPNAESAHDMRANVLRGLNSPWKVGPRSAAEFKEAATCYDRSAALCPAPLMKESRALPAGRLVPQRGGYPVGSGL